MQTNFYLQTREDSAFINSLIDILSTENCLLFITFSFCVTKTPKIFFGVKKAFLAKATGMLDKQAKHYLVLAAFEKHQSMLPTSAFMAVCMQTRH